MILSGLGTAKKSGVSAAFQNFLADGFIVEPDRVIGDAAGHGATGEELVAVKPGDGVMMRHPRNNYLPSP